MYRIVANKKGKRLVTVIDGEPVSLDGNGFTRVRQRGSKPPFVETVRGATQDDLRKLYESSGDWSRTIEKYGNEPTKSKGAGTDRSVTHGRKKKKLRGLQADAEPDTRTGNGRKEAPGDI